MTETVPDSCENSEAKILLSNKNIEFQSHLFTNHQEASSCSQEKDQIPIAHKTSEDLIHYDGITEVINPNLNKFQSSGVNETISANPSGNGEIRFNFSKDVTLEIKVDVDDEIKPLNPAEPSELCSPVETSRDDFVDFPAVHITELRHQMKMVPMENDEKPSVNHVIKKPLIRFKNVNEDGEYSYQGVSERIKRLVTSHSLDSESNNPRSCSQKNNLLTEKKKLSMDPQFERKIKELYSPPSVSSDNNGLPYVRNYGKVVPHRLDTNCEIIEENLSPVSETARQLQQQLSFPSSPISPDRSPRIPKTSRFSRLIKQLEQTPDPEVPTSPAETAQQNSLNT